jgi:polar amino acid transport system substrate-binding protein
MPPRSSPALTRRRLLAAAALPPLLAACAGHPPAAVARVRADLAPGGRLRAAINLGNPVLATRGPHGELRGVSVDLAHAIADRLWLPLDLVPQASAGQTVEALQAGRVDLAFVAIDPGRAVGAVFTPPYVVIEGAYLVRAGSPLQRNDEVDRPGTRVAVGRGSAYDLYLGRTLRQAALVRVPTSPEVVDAFLAQGLDVAAGVRQQLEADARRLGSSVRLLPGRFMVIEQALALPAGRPLAQAWLSGFVEEAKADGLVARALQRHGIEGAAVAPPAPRPQAPR